MLSVRSVDARVALSDSGATPEALRPQQWDAGKPFVSGAPHPIWSAAAKGPERRIARPREVAGWDLRRVDAEIATSALQLAARGRRKAAGLVTEMAVVWRPRSLVCFSSLGAAARESAAARPAAAAAHPSPCAGQHDTHTPPQTPTPNRPQRRRRPHRSGAVRRRRLLRSAHAGVRHGIAARVPRQEMPPPQTLLRVRHRLPR